MSVDVDWGDLCDLGAQLLEADDGPRHPDLRGQISELEIHTMSDVDLSGELL